MGTNFIVYPIDGNKKVFVNYEGAIREAIYLGCYVDNKGQDYQGGQSKMVCIFKVAGIGDNVSWEMSWMARRPPLYWSLQDAKDGTNHIGWRGLSVQEFNKSLKGGVLMDEQFGHLYSYVWKEKDTVGVYKETIYRSDQWTALYVDNQAVPYRNIKTKDPLPIPEGCYKTIEECKANNRPKVITF